MTRISLGRIRQAAAAIDPVFLGSPQYECEPLSHALGARLQFDQRLPGPDTLTVAEVHLGDQLAGRRGDVERALAPRDADDPDFIREGAQLGRHIGHHLRPTSRSAGATLPAAGPSIVRERQAHDHGRGHEPDEDGSTQEQEMTLDHSEGLRTAVGLARAAPW